MTSHVTVYTKQHKKGLIFKDVSEFTADETGVCVEQIVNDSIWRDFFPMRVINRVEHEEILDKEDE